LIILGFQPSNIYSFVAFSKTKAILPNSNVKLLKVRHHKKLSDKSKFDLFGDQKKGKFFLQTKEFFLYKRFPQGSIRVVLNENGLNDTQNKRMLIKFEFNA
jgi:hypothetical protein